jgi:hypothetical protein
MYLSLKFGDDPAISSGVIALGFPRWPPGTWQPYLKSDWAEILYKCRWYLETYSLKVRLF